MPLVAGSQDGANYGTVWLQDQATLKFSVTGSIMPEMYVGNGRGQYLFYLYYPVDNPNANFNYADIGIVWGPGPYAWTPFQEVWMSGSYQNTTGQLQAVPFRFDVRPGYASAGINAALHVHMTGGQGPGPTPDMCLARNADEVRSPSVDACDQSVGRPIDLATGMQFEEIGDFDIGGRGPGLHVGHSYRSLLAGTDGPLGFGWTHDYAMSLAFPDANTAEVREEQGSRIRFGLENGAYVAPARIRATLVHNADQTWTFKRRGRDSFTFGADGKLVSITVPNGYTTIVHYTAGVLDYVQDAMGRRLNFLWQAGRVWKIQDPFWAPAHEVTFGYDGSGNLVDVWDVASGNTHFGYDAAHRLTTMRTPRQSAKPAAEQKSVTTEYDASGRAWRQTDELGRIITLDYASIAGGVAVTDPKGNVTAYTFSDLVCTSITAGYGTPSAAQWLFEHDPATLRVTKVTNPLNQIVGTAEYDGSGNMTKLTDGLGHNTLFGSYNQFNEPSSITDRMGVATTLAYDGSGNLTSISTPLDGTQTRLTQLNYDPAHPGDVTAVTDPNNKTWVAHYDTWGNLDALTDPTGNKTTWSYNSSGWPLSMVAPKGNVSGGTPSQYTTTFSGYTPLGDLKVVTDPLGHTVQRNYDANRNVISSTDGDNHTTLYEYDDVDQLTTVRRPDDSVLLNAYWPDGSLKSQTDAANQVTQYNYNARGELQQTIDPTNNSRFTLTDPAGRLILEQPPGGNCIFPPLNKCTQSSYDGAGQLKTVSHNDGGVTPDVTDISYDDNGRRLSLTQSNGVNSSWTWDALGRMTSSSDGSTGAVSYGYDLTGNNTTIAYPGAGHTVTRAFDDAGRLHTATDWLSNVTTFNYDANSNLSETLFPGGAVKDVYGFDRADRLTSTTMLNGAATLASLTYGRDNAGLLTSQAQTGLPGAASETYGYNSLNQLTQRNGVSTWTYDPADNLTRTSTPRNQGFNAANQLCYTSPTATGTCAAPPADSLIYSYDNRGNRITADPAVGVPSRYGYDQENRLTTAAVPTVTGAEGQYTPLPGAKLLDTRSGSVTGTCTPSPCASIPAGGTITVQVTGKAGVPATGVQAVAMSMTVYTPGATGNAVVYPSDIARPNIQTINYSSGQTATNNVIAKVGADGRVAIYSTKAVNVELDVEGWFASATGPEGAAFTAVTPVRMVDTRSGSQMGQCPDAAHVCSQIPAGGSIDVNVAGQAGLPATGATAIAVQITTYNPAATGTLTAYASTDAQPPTRAVSYKNGQTQTTAADVKIGANNRIKLAASTAVNITVDVVGYYKDADLNAGGSVYKPITPVGLIDTATGTGPCTPSPCARLTAGGTTTVTLTGSGVPYDAAAVVVDITTKSAAAVGVLTAYASGTTRPNVRTAALDPARTITTHAIVPVGFLAKIDIYADKATDVDIDIVGYFKNDTGTWTYGYNGDGLRITKSYSFFTDQHAWSQNGSLPLLLADTNGFSGDTTYYLYGPDGLPYEQLQSNGTVRYLHHDQLGSTRLVTNGTGGVTGSATYDPYGAKTGSTGSLPALGYAGEYTDNETGFVYLRARFYDPATGQFLTRDPIESITRSAYGYVGGSPLNGTDPSGLCGPLCVVIVGAVVSGGIDLGFQMLDNAMNGCGLFDDINWVSVAGWAAFGAVTAGAGYAVKAWRAGRLAAGGASVAKTSIVASDGTQISGFTGHGVQRAIGDGGKRAGVTPRALLDALQNPVRIASGIDDLGRPFKIYRGVDARVVINPSTGRIVSVNPLSRAGASR